jgi:tetratricopeptide (TPR) repeat protein
VNVPKAVEIGEAAAINCKDDDAFMLAYSLARIDLSAQVKFGTPAQRAEYFNSAIYDLRALDAKVRSGKSEHYEIFNVLGFIYYEAGQYQKSIEELNAAGPFLKKMSPISAQKTLITLGAAQGQLGQNDAGARSFDEAVTFGYPSAKAKELKRKMLGSHWAS